MIRNGYVNNLYVCKLFYPDDDPLHKDGFDDWIHISQRVTTPDTNVQLIVVAKASLDEIVH